MSYEVENAGQMTAVHVTVFGPLTDIFSGNRFPATVTLPATADELREQLVEQYPVLADHRFRVAVDDVLPASSSPVREAAEIALLPAFAGG